MTLRDARSRAEARAPEVRRALNRIREAEATRVGAGIVMPVNPSLRAEVRPGVNMNTEGQFGYGSALDIIFEVFGAPGARKHEAELRAVAAKAEAALVRLEAKLAVTDAYVATALARQHVDNAHQAESIAERLVTIAGERAKAGAGNDVELTTAKAELAQRRADAYAAESAQFTSEMRLRMLADLAVDLPFHLTSDIDDLEPVPDVQVMVARAHHERPELALIYAQVALLRASDERLRKEALPKMGTYIGVDAAPASPVFGYLGVTVELPLAQHNQRARAVNAAEVQTTLDAGEVIIRRINVEITHRRGAHEATRRQLEVLAQDGIPTAERRLSLVEEGFRSGRFDVFRVTRAADDLVRLRALRLNALGQLWQERLALERLVGGFPSERI